MKKIFLIIFAVLLPSFVQALVYDTINRSNREIVRGITAFPAESVNVRINGKKINLKKYVSAEPVKKILEACLAESDKSKGVTINNEYLWMAANSLFKGAGSISDPVSFGYIFTIDKSGRAVFTVAGSEGVDTEIIRLDIPEYGRKTKGWYNDGLNMYPGSDKKISIELLNGKNTVNFGNLYLLSSAGIDEVIAYYEGEFKKNKIKVLKKTTAEDTVCYVLETAAGEMVFNATANQNGEISILIVG